MSYSGFVWEFLLDGIAWYTFTPSFGLFHGFWDKKLNMIAQSLETYP